MSFVGRPFSAVSLTDGACDIRTHGQDRAHACASPSPVASRFRQVTCGLWLLLLQPVPGVASLLGVPGNITSCCIDILPIAECYIFTGRWGRGGVTRPPRHRPQLLVLYRPASTREPPPPQSTGKGSNIRRLPDDRDPSKSTEPFESPNSVVASTL